MQTSLSIKEIQIKTTSKIFLACQTGKYKKKNLYTADENVKRSKPCRG